MTTSPPARIERFDELTAARGFAACFVVLYHVNAYTGGFLAQLFPPLDYGPLAVDFFFVLSGFVLTHVYRDAWLAGAYSHFGFLLKRFARVWPLHLATLLGVAMLIVVGSRFGLIPEWRPTAYSFVMNLLMLHATGLVSELDWNQPSWSISAEWCAYVAFPLFLVAVAGLRGLGARIIASFVLFGICLVLARLVLHADLMELTTNFGVLRIVPSFFAGVVLRYVLDQPATQVGAVAAQRITPALWIVLAVALAAGFFGAPNATFWPLILVGILLLALRGRAAAPGLLRAAPLIWLGDVSYALYLVHAPTLMLVFGLGGKLLHVSSPLGLTGLGLAGFALALGTAHIAHVLIERPAQVAIVRLGRRRLQAAPA
jgi:peptidoglycan/LPS O-acetylase OafA/YrhL